MKDETLEATCPPYPGEGGLGVVFTSSPPATLPIRLRARRHSASALLPAADELLRGSRRNFRCCNKPPRVSPATRSPASAAAFRSNDLHLAKWRPAHAAFRIPLPAARRPRSRRRPRRALARP